MGTAPTPSRPVIAQSWQRAALSGLDPAVSVEDYDIGESDGQSSLMRAATPVLDEAASLLQDTGFVVVLADRDARLVDLRFGDRALSSRLERIGVVRGRVFAEETTGTNSIATTLEVGHGVAVHGEEHFIDALKQFSCYGHPVFHPVTRRLEGVLDITCLTVDESPLLAPFLVRTARQIEHRLLAGAKAAEQRIFAAFQATLLRDRTAPVVALSGDVFLANAAAVELLDAADHAVLRSIAVDAPATHRLRLTSGQRVRISIERLSEGAVLVFEREAANTMVAAKPAPQAITVVSGEPGSGHTSAVRESAGAAEIEWFDASDAIGLGEQPWLDQLTRALMTAAVVAIEAIELLPQPVARRVTRALACARARVVLTSAPLTELEGEHARLVAQCVERIGLVPLCKRREEIPSLILSMLAELGAPRELRFTPSALEALAGQPWPGNLRELHAVVRQIVQTRTVGDVTVHDLPEAYRGQARSRLLTPIEQAEHDAIIDALRTSGGNKLEAAHRLGISRTTLYRAIARYGIIAPLSRNGTAHAR
ncbi:sigma-54-dependent Fis family transcriptional regulator [Nocardia suismassiliense]|uniref:sigma-54-dependent Fis family transcriptional regulator n=1 Tax=Nocardia suismassiliense TaxID=2077092 RepID=UPI000D1DA46F|nr:helix-turn-helix domain-containing protein [Nocardia suismassiliense]